jgi:hypothetical protein
MIQKMNSKKAIDIIEKILTDYPLTLDEDDALKIAIGAIKRDSKVDDITLHWNDEKSTFVAACNAFEDILKVYGRGVEADNEI